MSFISISIYNSRTRKTNRIKQKKRKRKTRKSNVIIIECVYINVIESSSVEAQQKEDDYGL
jgi:hypothetical protein